MSFLRRLFGGGSTLADGAPSADGMDSGGGEPLDDGRAAVTVWMRLADAAFENAREEQRVFELENRVINALETARAGTYDTNDLVPGAFGMRILCDDPARVVALLRPLLSGAPAGSYIAVRRAGASGEERLEIDPEGEP